MTQSKIKTRKIGKKTNNKKSKTTKNKLRKTKNKYTKKYKQKRLKRGGWFFNKSDLEAVQKTDIENEELNDIAKNPYRAFITIIDDALSVLKLNKQCIHDCSSKICTNTCETCPLCKDIMQITKTMPNYAAPNVCMQENMETDYNITTKTCKDYINMANDIYRKHKLIKKHELFNKIEMQNNSIDDFNNNLEYFNNEYKGELTPDAVIMNLNQFKNNLSE